jgi:ElaB/YqjD/DUF883 family membrane-anchored ribosome-binding protein
MKENSMSTYVSKITDLVSNAFRAASQLVRRSPWVAAAVAAMIVLLFLA